MQNIAIQANGLCKAYRLKGQREGQTTLRDSMAGISKAIANRLKGTLSGEDQLFWALKDVSFQIKQGHTIGLIGRNGSGKSTLLKILSRITEPSQGTVKIRGRVASLLEVGTGFHQELTGRENVFLNGAILGMGRVEIRRKFDQIAAFAEVGKFLDVPVKHYSSGMYVRLAFAVAAHLEPDVLIVDEVLAVGDADFQKKCLGKMNAVATEGRTVLFVSHNMAAVKNLCLDCIWMDKGTIRKSGTTEEIIGAYLNRFNPSEMCGEVDLSKWEARYGEGGARILNARLLDADGKPVHRVRRQDSVTVEFSVEGSALPALHYSAVVMSDSGTKVLHCSHLDGAGPGPAGAKDRCLVRLTVPRLPLCAGKYSLILGLHTKGMMPVDVVLDVLPFIAEDMEHSPRPYRTAAENALCWVPNEWSFNEIS